MTQPDKSTAKYTMYDVEVMHLDKVRFDDDGQAVMPQSWQRLEVFDRKDGVPYPKIEYEMMGLYGPKQAKAIAYWFLAAHDEGYRVRLVEHSVVINTTNERIKEIEIE